MLERVFVGFVLLFAYLFPPGLMAVGDIAEGQAKAVTCIGCHGANGIAVVPTFPNLAGQKASYLITAVASYHNGKRNNPAMKAITAGLSKADIENIAAYFSSLPRK